MVRPGTVEDRNVPASVRADARRLRPLRVGHLTTVDSTLAILLQDHLRACVTEGHQVFGISSPGPFVSELEAMGVVHVPVANLTRSWSPRRDAAAALELARCLPKLELDVLHTHTPKAGVLGRVVGRLAGTPAVVNTVHGLWATLDDPLPLRTGVTAVEAFAACFSDVELYVNREDRRRLAWAVDPRRSLVLGNGVDLARFRPDPDARRQVREELGIPDGGLVVGAVGRRVAEKGLREFATMAQTLAGRASFVWIGPPDDQKPDRIDEELPGVRFLGLRRDMPRLYSALDVFVLPSYREGLPVSAMEAAAVGCALVLTDIRGSREIGEHGRHLLLVPPADPAALTEAVAVLLEDRPMRERLASNAHVRARERFDQREISATVLAVYRDALRRREASP